MFFIETAVNDEENFIHMHVNENFHVYFHNHEYIYRTSNGIFVATVNV